MRVALVSLLGVLTAGCIDEREPFEADPHIAIASARCDIAGAQVIIEATFDVRLQAGQAFRVEQTAALGSASANVYAFYGCNEWKKMQHGCVRLDDQPQTQPVSVRMTDNITSGTLPEVVRIELAAIVDSDPASEDALMVATRTISCSR